MHALVARSSAHFLPAAALPNCTALCSGEHLHQRRKMRSRRIAWLTCNLKRGVRYNLLGCPGDASHHTVSGLSVRDALSYVTCWGLAADPSSPPQAPPFLPWPLSRRLNCRLVRTSPPNSVPGPGTSGKPALRLTRGRRCRLVRFGLAGGGCWDTEATSFSATLLAHRPAAQAAWMLRWCSCNHVP